jgi:hypothetical protein
MHSVRVEHTARAPICVPRANTHTFVHSRARSLSPLPLESDLAPFISALTNKQSSFCTCATRQESSTPAGNAACRLSSLLHDPPCVSKSSRLYACPCAMCVHVQVFTCVPMCAHVHLCRVCAAGGGRGEVCSVSECRLRYMCKCGTHVHTCSWTHKGTQHMDTHRHTDTLTHTLKRSHTHTRARAHTHTHT